MSAVAIVLAAGKGTRMRSDLPKVLHPLGGRPLVLHATSAAQDAGVERFIVVVGHGAEAVREAVEGELGDRVTFALQAEQNGTGHAVACALDQGGVLEGTVLILSGDVPLLRARTLRELVAASQRSSSGLAFVTFRPEDPTGYGRVVRDARGRPVLIREHRDASDEERGIAECNAGIYGVSAEMLTRHLPALGSSNAQGEVYLTDLVERLAREAEVLTLEVEPLEVAGVNTPEQLRQLDREWKRRGD